MDGKHDGAGRKRRDLVAVMAGAMACAAALMLGGCAGAGAPPISTAEVAAGLESYHLGAGDRVRVTVFNEPTLTGEYNITPGGALAFPLINWFQALLPDNWEKGAAQMLAIPLVIIGLLVFSAVSYLLAHFGISIFKKR
mgnify:CR=1 FL=1